MKNFILFTLAILLSSCAIQNIPISGREDIQFYPSITEFKNNNPSKIVYTKILEKGDDFIKVHDFFDKATDKRVLRGNVPWAIKYQNQIYFNLGYSVEYQNFGLYAKYDIIGKISVLFIDDETSTNIKSSGANFGGGLVGVVMQNAEKWGKNWKDLNGKVSKVLIVSTEKIKTKYVKEYVDHLSKLLTKKNFNSILRTNFTKEEIAKFSLEDVKRIIQDINRT